MSGLTEMPNTLRSITDAFTPEEIEKYATYHWRQVGQPVRTRDMTSTEGPEFDYSHVVCHVWQTIGGMYRYLGTIEDIQEGREPAEQLPLIPALDLSDVDGGGPVPSCGGTLPWQRPLEAEGGRPPKEDAA